MSTALAWIGFVFVLGCVLDWFCGLSMKLRAIVRGLTNQNINADVNLVVGMADAPRGSSADPLTPTENYQARHQMFEHRALGRKGG